MHILRSLALHLGHLLLVLLHYLGVGLQKFHEFLLLLGLVLKMGGVFGKGVHMILIQRYVIIFCVWWR